MSRCRYGHLDTGEHGTSLDGVEGCRGCRVGMGCRARGPEVSSWCRLSRRGLVSVSRCRGQGSVLTVVFCARVRVWRCAGRPPLPTNLCGGGEIYLCSLTCSCDGTQARACLPRRQAWRGAPCASPAAITGAWPCFRWARHHMSRHRTLARCGGRLITRSTHKAAVETAPCSTPPAAAARTAAGDSPARRSAAPRSAPYE